MSIPENNLPEKRPVIRFFNLFQLLAIVAIWGFAMMIITRTAGIIDHVKGDTAFPLLCLWTLIAATVASVFVARK